ncbi:Cytochrome P450 71D10 [Linum perenne]
MELPLDSTSLFFIILSFLAFLYTLIHLISLNSSTPISGGRVPPAPPKLPLIGNLHQLKSSPHRSLADLASKHGPIMRLQLGQLTTTVISSADLARDILTTHDVTFANRPVTAGNRILSYGLLDIGFAPYGPYWRQLRKICKSDLLSPGRVGSFRKIREDEAAKLVREIGEEASGNGLLGQGGVNLSKKLVGMTYGIALSSAFGRNCGARDEYFAIVHRIFKMMTGFTLVNLFPSVKVLQWVTGMKPKLMKLHREKDGIVQRILDEHKQRRRRKMNGGSSIDGNEAVEDGEGEEEEEDLTDVLLKFQEPSDLEFPLTDDSIKANLWDMVTAGAETSSATMEWAMSEMLLNPQVMQRAQAEVRQVYAGKPRVDESLLQELHYLKAVIKETLRLHPPSPLLMPRESSEGCEIKGYNIPSKSRVIINAWAIQRDPEYWPDDPEKFAPERFIESPLDYKGSEFHFIPFGGGRRMCPGVFFAQANVELSLANLLFHFEWKLPEGVTEENMDMSESFGLAVTRKQGLIAVPIPYRPSLN